MNAADFELKISLPADKRFAETMRELASHAARYAGCFGAEADRYGATVERVVLACVERGAAGKSVPVVLRRGAGPLECLIGCERKVELEAGSNARISVGWTGQMCRVSLDL